MRDLAYGREENVCWVSRSGRGHRTIRKICLSHDESQEVRSPGTQKKAQYSRRKHIHYVRIMAKDVAVMAVPSAEHLKCNGGEKLCHI
jgi:hypothetical protein